MARPATPREMFTGVAADGRRTRATDLRVELCRSWGPVGVVGLRSPGPQTFTGWSLNHSIALNTGRDLEVEIFDPASGWSPCVLPQASLLVMPAGVRFGLKAMGAGNTVQVDVAPDLVADVLGGAAAFPFEPALADPQCEAVVRALAAEAAAGSRHGVMRAEKLAAVLVSRVAERLCGSPREALRIGALPSARLRRVLEHVGSHLDRPIGLCELAEIAGLSPFHFSRAFKLSTGLAPYHYVLSARVERAKALLSDSSLSITEIALATGFTTPSHFSVTFRRLTGTTPREFRDPRP